MGLPQGSAGGKNDTAPPSRADRLRPPPGSHHYRSFESEPSESKRTLARLSIESPFLNCSLSTDPSADVVTRFYFEPIDSKTLQRHATNNAALICVVQRRRPRDEHSRESPGPLKSAPENSPESARAPERGYQVGAWL